MHQSILVHHKSHADQSLFEFQKKSKFQKWTQFRLPVVNQIFEHVWIDALKRIFTAKLCQHESTFSVTTKCELQKLHINVCCIQNRTIDSRL